MRVLVPDYAMNNAAHAMAAAGVHSALMHFLPNDRKWLIEFMLTGDRPALAAALAKIGARVLPLPVDTATGLQAGSEPVG